MKRTRTLAGALVGLLMLGASVIPANAAAPQEPALGDDSVCTSHRSLCVDPFDTLNNEYVGHDEPSVLFKSSVPGSGNDMTYQVTLPKEPKEQPQNDGSGGTWNFQLRPTFWFGLTMCDTESAPEYTKECKADSDSNALEGLDPSKADYIGHHPGNAYMELQFYGPGYVPQFEGFGCSATQYCAAMTIDSLSDDQATDVGNNARLRQLHPGRPRADQLGVHHQEWQVPGAGQPVVHRHVRRPEPVRGDPGLQEGPDDEPG